MHSNAKVLHTCADMEQDMDDDWDEFAKWLEDELDQVDQDDELAVPVDQHDELGVQVDQDGELADQVDQDDIGNITDRGRYHVLQTLYYNTRLSLFFFGTFNYCPLA